MQELASKFRDQEQLNSMKVNDVLPIAVGINVFIILLGRPIFSVIITDDS